MNECIYCGIEKGDTTAIKIVGSPETVLPLYALLTENIADQLEIEYGELLSMTKRSIGAKKTVDRMNENGIEVDIEKFAEQFFGGEDDDC